MPRVGFEPTIPVFKRAKTVHALGCTDTVIGMVYYLSITTQESNIKLISSHQQTDIRVFS
jgi:hypothetical protein